VCIYRSVIYPSMYICGGVCGVCIYVGGVYIRGVCIYGG